MLLPFLFRQFVDFFFFFFFCVSALEMKLASRIGNILEFSMWRVWRGDSYNVGMILLHCNIKLWQCNKSKKCSKRVTSRHVEIQNVASVVESPARHLPTPRP